MKKALIIVFVFWSQINLAQTLLGDYFTYQGELVVNGQVANGNYEFEAQFYDASTNGNNIANNFNIAATVTDGLFTLQLDIGGGSFIGDEVWLELLVKPAVGGTQVSLLPRQLITNSPYSIQAKYVGNDGVSTISIVNAAVTTAKLANGAVTAAKLAGDSVTSAKIANGTIETVDISSQAVTRVQIAANTIQRSEVDSTQIQERVTGTCAAGSSIRVIAQDGSVTCETDDTGGGSAGWGLTGNAGTTPGTNFIGTTDIQTLTFKVNNITGMRIVAGTEIGNSSPNLILGASTNFISTTNSSGMVVAGGENNKINGVVSTSYGSSSVIGGGRGNIINNSESVIAGGVLNVNHSNQAFIGGGNSNEISTDGFSSVIAGGFNNLASGNHSFIPGGVNNKTYGLSSFAAGELNIAGGDNSVAFGKSASVRTPTLVGGGNTTGDAGTFIWSQTGVISTGPNQVLFEAQGGFGIGTNAPASPFHVKGQGTTFGTALTEVVMAVEPNTVNDDVSLAINRLASNKESALLFTTNQSPDFDIRSVDGQALDFTNYDNLGSPRLMMRINDGTTQRVDINGNLEPWVGGVYNLGGINGGSEFRWSTLYTVNVDTTNPINVTSDRRLKDNIKEIGYGLADILSMNPVTYSLKSDDSKKIHMGLIAQEVEMIIPEIVNQRNDDMRTRSMRYGELIPVLIKATQEQQVLIEQQNKHIAELKEMVNSLVSNRHYNK